MTNAIRRIGTCGALLSLAILSGLAAAQTAPTALDKQLNRIDFGVSGVGQFTGNNTGTTYLPQQVTDTPSNTLGALIEFRYIKSPLVGVVFNYGYARYTENFNISNVTGSPKGALAQVLGVQTKVNEYTLGYVAHAHSAHFGVIPFAGAGAGAIAFEPTRGGGEGVTPVFRSAFYYNVGVEQLVYGDHFGLRLQFRQVFFGAPDFNENYLATGQRSVTSEPGIGFYIHF